MSVGIVTIFDWDDTLICSTWIKQCGTAVNHTEMTKLERHAMGLLDKALANGAVYIITSSNQLHFMLTLTRFYPNLLRRIIDRCIRTFTYEHNAKDTGSPIRSEHAMKWKLTQMKHVICSHSLNFQLVNFSDSEADCCVFRQLATERNQLFKCIKMMGRPSCNSLQRQLTECTRMYDGVLASPDSLDIEITI